MSEKRENLFCKTIVRNFANKKAATPWHSRLTAHYIQIVAAFWYARRDSNPQPSEPESDALSNCATGASDT